MLSNWEIEYTHAPLDDPVYHSILVGWFYQDQLGVYDHGATFRIVFRKDVIARGILFHYHRWVTFAEVRSSFTGNVLHSIERIKHGIDKTYVTWWDEPQMLPAGHSIDVTIRGHTVMHVSFGFDLYFHCADGTDTLRYHDEAFEVVMNPAPPTLPPTPPTSVPSPPPAASTASPLQFLLVGTFFIGLLSATCATLACFVRNVTRRGVHQPVSTTETMPPNPGVPVPAYVVAAHGSSHATGAASRVRRQQRTPGRKREEQVQVRTIASPSVKRVGVLDAIRQLHAAQQQVQDAATPSVDSRIPA